MLNTKIKKAFFLLFISILVGCGGSGDSGDSSDSSDSSNSSNSSNSGDSGGEPTVIAMGDLVASDDFSFTSKQQITVALDLNDELDLYNQAGERAYVSIYSDYKLLPSGTFYPVSSSRVFGGDLNDGLVNHSFVSLNQQSTYLIEVWFYNGEEPIQKEQTIVANSLIW